MVTCLTPRGQGKPGYCRVGRERRWCKVGALRCVDLAAYGTCQLPNILQKTSARQSTRTHVHARTHTGKEHAHRRTVTCSTAELPHSQMTFSKNQFSLNKEWPSHHHHHYHNNNHHSCHHLPLPATHPPPNPSHLRSAQKRRCGDHRRWGGGRAHGRQAAPGRAFGG